MRHNINFFRYITSGVGTLTICLLFTQCIKCKDENASILDDKKLFSIKQQSRVGRGAHYVEITITPLSIGDKLSQYTLQAVTSAGNGMLKTSTGTTGIKHNYDQDLKTTTPLTPLYFINKTNAADFEQGKSVTLKCKYECPSPNIEEHRVKITARASDSGGKAIKESEEEVNFKFANTEIGKAALFSINQKSRVGRGAHYVEVTITPLSIGDKLSQYTLQTVTSAGNGMLKTSTGTKHNYDQDLTTATPLTPLYFINKTNAADFEKGKSVTLKCKYECPNPNIEEHCVKITARAFDSGGKVIKESEQEVNFKFANTEIAALLSIKQQSRVGNGAHYVNVTITPLNIGDKLSQYTLQAETSTGNGMLKTSTGTNHNYDQDLTTATKLTPLYFITKPNAANFEKGKSVTLKCKYECPSPNVEEHRVKITACAYDSGGKVIKKSEQEVAFAYTDKDFSSKAKGTKKSSASKPKEKFSKP